MARKRAPGGGRKPLEPHLKRSAPLVVRVRPEVKEGIERAAEQHKRKFSREIQRALDYWIQRLDIPHIAGLADDVIKIAEQVERQTGKKFNEDKATAAALSVALMRYCQEMGFPSNPDTDTKRIGEKTGDFVAMLNQDYASRWTMPDDLLGFTYKVEFKSTPEADR